MRIIKMIYVFDIDGTICAKDKFEDGEIVNVLLELDAVGEEDI